MATEKNLAEVTDQDTWPFPHQLAEGDTKTELVLVECISTFRERYVVEVPHGKKEWALDTVTMNETVEFSQEHLGETIVSHRVIDEAEFNRLHEEDNDYLKNWTSEQRKTLITQIENKENTNV
jgi:hypothetical protein